jgi:predicted aspartyl protease
MREIPQFNRVDGSKKSSLVKLARLAALAGLIIAATLFLRASMQSQGAPLITLISYPVSIPAEISDHQMFVDVMVNGRGPFRVMVDTGCSLTLVSPELAEAVDAKFENQDDYSVFARNGLGDATDVQQVTLGTIDLGSVRFEGVTAAVSDSFDKLSLIQGQRVDGALGFPLFANLFLGLDFPNQRLLLSKTWPANVPAVRTSLPVTEHMDVPFVQVKIQGMPVDVMIDTGANQALQLPIDFVSKLSWKAQPRAGSLVAVIGEVGREGIGRLAGNLTLGDIDQVEPTAVISTGSPSIGLRSLESFCVIFHQSENRVWLCGQDSAPIAPKVERSDGLSLYSDAGGWRVAGVIPGSPAAQAHISAGALVTQIENRPAKNWTRDQMQQWIDTHLDIAIVIAEDSGERALTLPAWDLVP